MWSVKRWICLLLLLQSMKWHNIHKHNIRCLNCQSVPRIQYPHSLNIWQCWLWWWWWWATAHDDVSIVTGIYGQFAAVAFIDGYLFGNAQLMSKGMSHCCSIHKNYKHTFYFLLFCFCFFSFSSLVLKQAQLGSPNNSEQEFTCRPSSLTSPCKMWLAGWLMVADALMHSTVRYSIIRPTAMTKASSMYGMNDK